MTRAVQAHATAHRVALFYAAVDATRAAYLKDWDSWRAAGIAVEPCYLTADSAAAGVGAAGAGSSGNGTGGGAEPQAVLVRHLFLSQSAFSRSRAWTLWLNLCYVHTDQQQPALARSGTAPPEMALAAALDRRLSL